MTVLLNSSQCKNKVPIVTYPADFQCMRESSTEVKCAGFKTREGELSLQARYCPQSCRYGHTFSLHYGKLLKAVRRRGSSNPNLDSSTSLNVKFNCSVADSNPDKSIT